MAKDSTMTAPAVEGVIRFTELHTVAIFCTPEEKWAWRVFLRDKDPKVPEKKFSGEASTREKAEAAASAVLR